MSPIGAGAGDAVLVVDLQHDFLPGGALGVPGGDRVLVPIAGLVRRARAAGVPVLASRDRHPAGHVSFADRGGPWPPHCVVGTDGAELHPGLPLDGVAIVDKGTELDRDAYSAFDGTGLADRLRADGVSRVLVCGLATDYCVRATAIDAVEAGCAVVVLEDAVAAVDGEPGDGARTLAELEGRGVVVAPAPPA